MKKLQILLVASLIFALVACEPTIDTPMGTKKLGTLGADNKSLVYVAIGTSISAGTQSYACFAEATKYSFPNLLAGQMGVSTFVQPEYAEPGLGLRYMLRGFTSAGLPILDLVKLEGGVTNSSYSKPYNNLGIWAAIAYDLIDTSDFAARGASRENPYYLPVLRNPQFGASMVDQAIALAPNLITFEMGANDVLGYAKSGGAISTAVDNNGAPIPTPVESMRQLFGAALTKLTTALPNTKIILFTVPNVLGVPFFKTVPWNALLIDAATAAKLNAAYSQLGFTFAAGANGFVAESPKSPGKLRQLTAEDNLLLSVPQDSLKVGWGSLKPIPNQYVLDKFEAAIVSQSVTEYNAMIRGLTTISKNNNIVVFDLDQMLTNVINNGYAVPGGTTMTNKFISGEMFSLDGFHPTSRGQGAIVNELIKFMNMTYGADIPLVNIQSLPPNYVSPK